MVDVSELVDYLDEEEDLATLYRVADAGLPTGTLPVTFPTTPLRILVELLINGVWVDVSQYVLYEHRIVITRGRKPNQRRTTPAMCALTLKNQTRRFSPRNVTGAYYPYLGRGVKLRVSLDPGDGMRVRFTGRVPAWTPQARGHPDDRFVPVVAYGVRGRRQRGEEPLRSALFRAIGMEAETVRYWPCEDGAEAGSLAPAVAGQPTGATTAVMYAADSTLTGSAPLPRFDGAASSVFCPIWWPAPNARWQVDWHYYLPEAPAADTVVMQVHAGGTVVRWELVVLAGGGSYALRGYDAVGTLVENVSAAAPAGNPIYGVWSHWSLYVKQNGGNVDWGFTWLPSLGGHPGSAVADSHAGTMGGLVAWGIPASTGVSGLSFGHVVAYDAYNHTQPAAPVYGWAGDTLPTKETAADRFRRLCAEEGIDYVVAEQVVDTEHMGPQRAVALSDLLRECEDVNEGVIDETVDDQLRLVSRTYRWNREPPAMVVDYSRRLLQRPFAAADDDEWLRNDWTVTRVGGSTARFERASGPLNTSEPEDDPEGVGRAPDAATVNLNNDGQALAHAAYRVGRDTVDQPRFPQIRINFAQAPSLIGQWLACDTSSRVTIQHGVTWPDSAMYDASPTDIQQTLEGYVETITQVSWEADLFCEPYEVDKVGAYGGDSRYDCPATTLAEDLDTTETGVDVLITDTCAWAHDDGDYRVVAGGEVMLVTAVGAVGGTYPSRTQTLTVTRSVNGVVKTHDAGSRLGLAEPAYWAL